MSGNERLARAVLLFFRGGPWTDDDRAVWETMTGYPTPTAATLCEFAREVLSDERMRSQGLPRSPPPPPEEAAMSGPPSALQITLCQPTHRGRRQGQGRWARFRAAWKGE